MDQKELAERIAELPLEKRALLFEQLQKQKQREVPLRAAIPRASRAPGLFRLSFAQQRLWFLNQYEPDSPEYNIPQGFRILGPLSAEILRRTLEAIVARHEALRTTFKAVDGVPMQLIAPRQLVELPLEDLSDRPELSELSKAERETVARRIAYEDARHPFDLTLGPLFRALLFRIDEGEHLFFLNVHHIVYDGWSRGVLLAELAALYDAFAADRPSPLRELTVQYLDFALWQRDWLSGEVLSRQLSYWRQRLAGTPPLDLVTDRPRPALRTYNGASEPVFLDRAVVEALTRLGQAEGGTLYISLAAVWKALLHHYTGQEDLTVGTLIANRTRPELEKIIGFFANTLALRTDLSGDPSFRQLVAREREVALGAYAHQDLPFEKLVDEIHPQRDLARTPIFQSLLILLNTPAQALDISGLAISELAIDNATSKFEMTLYMVQGEEGISGYLEYNTDLFDAATVRRFLDHFRALAEGVAADPRPPLSEFPWLSAAEARQLLTDWNATAADFPCDRCLHELIAAQAARTPGAVAVELEGERLTYKDLDSQANRLAQHLRRLGVGPEVLVGLAVERSFDMVVGLLGILKAGGAYVPLDPEYPQERVAYMLEESHLSLLLTQEKLLSKLPATGARILALDRDREAIAAEEDRAPESGAGPRDLAYIIYTSGSTGKPKGVQIPHGAVVNFLASMSRRPGMTSADTLLAVTTLSFDIAGLELYLPLVVGARVVLVPRDVAQAGEQLLDRLVRSGTTVMQATPATWRLLLGAGFKGDGRLKVLCGGEALPRDLADSLSAAGGSLWNVYGPTEATIWSMLHEIERGGRITLGRPLDNTQVYLLSPRFTPVPVGVPGELHIGGAGLARGYRSRPDLTAERFIPDPYSGAAGARLYKTGDLARHLPDGTVEFLGRIDTQVKVRGFRIELGEIETVLAQHPGIAQTAVLAREDTPGTKRLVAYLVPRSSGEAPKSQELRDFLKARLPEYMVPALFETLPAFPLTPNGKVDRRSLPAPDKNRASERPYVAPSSPVEEALAALWAEALGVQRVGVNDDFFELGGDSLLVIRVVSKANKNGLGITTKQLFQNRTVAELAKVAGTTHILAEQTPVTGVIPFTPAQIHFIELQHTQAHYHSLGSLLAGKTAGKKVAGENGREIDPWAAREAFRAVSTHHDNLRVRLVEDEAGRRLVTDAPWEDLPFARTALPSLSAEAWERELDAILTDLIEHFDLARGPLFRAVLVERAGERTLILIGHFFVADIGSWQTILDDFDAAYRQALDGQPIRLQSKTTSARQWADRLAERAHSMDMKPEKEYWFSEARRSAPALPLDFPAGENSMASSLSVRVELDLGETRALLQGVQRAYGVQIDAILLTSVLFAFLPWTGSRKLLIDLLGHGREPLYDDIDLTRTVGWLNTIYPAFLTLPEGIDDPGIAVRHVNEQLRKIPNGGIGYGILRYLSRDEDFLSRARSMPQPGIFFNYFGDDHSQELATLTKVEGFGGYGLDRRTRRLRPLAIGVYIQKDRMLLKWERSTHIHRVETIEALANRSAEILRWFVAHHSQHSRHSQASR
jgi:amino acid adenylation domain-containing protein/non-ribosomal peptide synthase protein (TIGR01720 family)